MVDDFVTKQLYGSGEVDISFIDTAVDLYVRNNGLFDDVWGVLRENNSKNKGEWCRWRSWRSEGNSKNVCWTRRVTSPPRANGGRTHRCCRVRG